jgi:hypothetical protein
MGSALSSIGSTVSGMGSSSFGGTGSWFDNLLGNQSTASRYSTNPYSQQTSMLAEQDRGFR